ncbi:WbqC family protein [Vibrio sp. Vb1554]|uniref:WbqC family protein n=1 Tax=Vibrio sp. Vb1554 TaxID=3074642 RepID=UPI002966D994|nr:WbqC family protein [Vibrio sp. Vb1554]MDW3045615.1 WbqC family protein [Vibrio sp. Vb1554]
MKIAIMQPYFLPYIGYWQLLASVDKFVVYDDIQYTKKGWINRNRYLSASGKVETFTIPIKKDSDYLDVRERFISPTFLKERTKLLNKIRESYRKSPNFDEGYQIFSDILLDEEDNLFLFILNSIEKIKSYLDIDTEIIISSSLNNKNLKGQDRVIDTCVKLAGGTYINPPGGRDLYSESNFRSQGLTLEFLNVSLKPYTHTQTSDFEPGLSILDMIFNVPKTQLMDYLI